MSDRNKCAETCDMSFCEGGRNCAVHGTETPWGEIAAQLMTIIIAGGIIAAFAWKAII